MNLAVSGFEWDEGNLAKCQTHGVSIAEIESIFARPVIILPDDGHSVVEPRYKAIGEGATGRKVFLVFALRERDGARFIRPIGARYMHRKEIDRYEEENADLRERR